MKYSLLQTADDRGAVCEVIYDLSVDRAINNIMPDKRKADYFLSVLSKPLTNIENIKYRQEIFCDLKNVDGLFDALQLLFTRYDKIKSDWQEMKLGAASARGSGINPEALLDHTFSSLKVTAIFPSTIASFFRSIGKTLSEYKIASSGLIAIRDWCEKMSNDQALDELVNISQLFRYQTPDKFDFKVASELDGVLRLISSDISEITEHKSSDGFKLFKKKKADDGFDTVVSELSETGEDPYSDSLFMLNSALSRIDTALTQVTNDMYDAFFGLSSEMVFYETALKYIAAAEDSSVPTVMPILLPPDADRLDAVGLRELVLLSNGAGKKTVPNDISLGGELSGLLVKGLTDSGKTVYLRAVGTAQLFAQAGLPVLAESAEMSIRHGFFSHFSSAEEEFLSGDAAGRFDQEAKEIARIIEALRPHSLLLLNETFQTTSYKEGTESIYNILRHMPKLKTKYVFVTHLTRLFSYMENEKVILASTSDDEAMKYKIII